MGQLTIDFKRSPETLRFVLFGRIDATNANAFGDAVKSALIDSRDEDVVFDCTNLEYVSSMGLRVLLSLRKKWRGPVRLENVSREVRGILDITGFSQIVEVSGGNEQ
ncbi:MAG: STAS domain-containing protein [Synergistaceae bacterium]|nr:STAS domain-containing protein [Synergistaceae bacterium]